MKFISTLFFLLSSMAPISLKAQQSGSLDNSFGTGGTVLSFFSTFLGITYGKAVAVQNDGKILVAGRATATVGGQNLYGGVLARFNINGTKDNSFASNGVVDYLDAINSMVLQSDGKILLVSDARTQRFTVSGNPNSTFGNGLNVKGGKTIKLQSDGKIIVGNTITEGNRTGFLITRYTSEGILDNSFGVNGVAIQYFGHNNFAILYCMTIQKDDKIVLSGFETIGGATSSSNLIFARFNKNGSIYNSASISSKDIIYSIDSQSDGKLVAVGTTYDASTGYSKMIIFRFQAEEFIFDNSFGTSGIFIPPVSSGSSEAKSVMVQADNKILVSGYAYNNNSNSEDFALLKLKSDGKLDNTFGINGMVNTDIQNNEVANCIALQNDGKIVLAGTTYKSSNQANISIARYFNNISVAIQNPNNSNSFFKVYPNPVTNLLKVETPYLVKFQILNLLGQQVLNGSTSGHIDVSTLQKGIYLFKIGDYQTKFVKK